MSLKTALLSLASPFSPASPEYELAMVKNKTRCSRLNQCLMCAKVKQLIVNRKSICYEKQAYREEELLIT